MLINFKKFGTTLISRESGREAYKVIERDLRDLKGDENLIIDFNGVVTFSPSWGDETLTPLYKRYGKNMLLNNTQNLSVKATLELLQQIQAITFKKA